MAKRLWSALLAMACLLIACGGDDDAGASTQYNEPPNVVIVSSDDPGELTDDEFDRITIDGMPCIIWKDRRGSGQEQYAYSGLTCKWPAG